jgi:hypothetical protein
MSDKNLTDFERSETSMRWNLEQSILAYDQLSVAGNIEPRRRLKMLDGILATALKLAKMLIRRAEYEKEIPPKAEWDDDICICDVSRMLALIDQQIAS